MDLQSSLVQSIFKIEVFVIQNKILKDLQFSRKYSNYETANNNFNNISCKILKNAIIKREKTIQPFYQVKHTIPLNFLVRVHVESLALSDYFHFSKKLNDRFIYMKMNW
jgi:hypothetical protein